MGTDADKEENYSFSQTGPGHQLDLPSWHYTYEPGRFGFGDSEKKKSNLISANIEETGLRKWDQLFYVNIDRYAVLRKCKNLCVFFLMPDRGRMIPGLF